MSRISHSQPQKLATMGPRFAILCFGVWLHASENMLVATTLPSAVREFGGGDLISWAFSLYLLGTILAGAGTGLLLRSNSIKAALIRAAVIFALGTVVCAITPNMYILLLGRTIQGIGGGFLVALAFVCINRWYAPDMLPRLLAITSVVWSVSALFGPVVGGGFATFGNWRMAFWVFVLQALLLIVVTAKVIPSSKASTDKRQRGGFPAGRLTVLCAAVLLVSVAGTYVHIVISPLLCLLAIGLLWSVFQIDRATTNNRMFPVESMQLSRPLGAGLAFVFLISVATMSFLVYGPLLLETLYGVTPFTAGFIVAIESVFWGIGAYLVSYVPRLARVSETLLIRLGTVTVTLSILGYAIFVPSGILGLLILTACFQGLGYGIMWAFVVKHISLTASKEELDVVSSAIPTLQNLGFAFGAAASGIVANAAGFAETITVSGAQTAGFWVFAAFLPIASLSIFAAWRLTNKPDISQSARHRAH